MNELSVRLKDIHVTFGNKDLFHIEALSAYMNDRIAIIGPNGAGKSTLLKMIAGTFNDFEGSVQVETDFNYFSQIGEPAVPVDEDFNFELLSRLDVPDNEGLSGGEETKFRLAHALSEYKLGLLLDEPTMHLDEAGVELLTDELKYYYGTLICVSHDRHFINSIAEKIWEVSDGTVKEYAGTMMTTSPRRKLNGSKLKGSMKISRRKRKGLRKWPGSSWRRQAGWVPGTSPESRI